MAFLSFLKRHRYAVVDYGVLLVALCVCVPLLVLVPDARPYCATLLAWSLVFALHLWRWLPWERARLRRRAHRRADAVMQARGVGRRHREAKSLRATSVSWSATAMGDERPGNELPQHDGVAGDESSSDNVWGERRRRKFLHDTADSSTALTFAPPQRRPAEGEAEGYVEDSGVVTAPAPMLPRGASPLPRISPSAMESSSQFLALATCASPLRTSPSPPQEVGAIARPSHEPFTFVSRGSPASLEDTTTMSTPSLSTIEPDDGASAAVPMPSLSPASSCQTHGYMPPSPLLNTDGAESVFTASQSSSSVRSPSHISILSSAVLCLDGPAPRPRAASLNG